LRGIIALGETATLKIEKGALVIRHRPTGEQSAERRFDVDEPPPSAILFDGRGEWLSGEALRWCARRNIAIVMPDGPGAMLTFVRSAAEAKDGEALPDIGPAIVRAQCAADPIEIAREIVRAKIVADAKGLGPRREKRCFDVLRYEAKLNAAPSVAEIVMIEAKAANAYWRTWRDQGLIERKAGDLPRTWLRFAQRNKGARFLGNKHASHPLNAALNYCIVVEAGRLARALTAHGMILTIGYLHADRHGRNSLVWDCIEPLRAKIACRVFAYIASRTFSRRDFPPAGIDVRRIARPVVNELLQTCLLPDRDIHHAAIWLRDLVLSHASPPRPKRGRPAKLPDRE